MHRYLPPLNCSGVFAPSGEVRVNDAGLLELPDDAPFEDHRALLSAGCVLTPPDPVVGAVPTAGAAQADLTELDLTDEEEIHDEA